MSLSQYTFARTNLFYEQTYCEMGIIKYLQNKSIGGLRMSSVSHLYKTLPSTVSPSAGVCHCTKKAGAPLKCNEGSTKARIQNEHCPR